MISARCHDAPFAALETLEPRLLLSANIMAPSPAVEILPDLVGTEVAIDPGTASTDADPAENSGNLSFSGVLDIYIEPGLQTLIQPALDVYLADLTDEGYVVTAREFSGTAEDLRAQLQTRHAADNIEGAVFIGDLPTLTFRNDHDFDDKTVSFLHDLYFMDLDGEYILHSDDTPDEHFDLDLNDDGVLEGDVGPEIYVSRLTPSPIAGMTGRSESELIVEYLNRVHQYRSGGLYYADRSVLWSDDDWSWSEYKLGDLYDEHLVINDDAETTRQSYLDTLTLNYESMLEMIHSSVTYHRVYGEGGGKVTSSDVYALNPRIGFYNMWNCSSAKFTSTNNLISTYVYGSDYGLNAVGSTKTGSMLTTQYFYNDQAAGLSVGQAFANTLDRYAAETTTNGYASSWVNWYYGMTMQGDPTLRPALMGDGAPRALDHTPSGDVSGPQSSLAITFNKAMDPTSFDLGDVSSFTGPGGIDLLGELNNWTWSDDQTLTLSFSTQSLPGDYSLTIGPELADTDGNLLNQDGDDIAGESGDDTYTAMFTVLNAAPTATIESPSGASTWMRDETNLLLVQASVTDDGYGLEPLTHNWSVETAPAGATATIEDPSALETAVRLSGPGEYVLRISATDGQHTDRDELRVTVGDPQGAVADPDVLWYPLDDGAGLLATDATDQGRDGTVSGASWTEGHTGTALQFAGDGRVLDEDAENYLNGLEEFTVASWIRSDRVGVDMGWLVGRDTTNGDDVLGIRYDQAGASGGGTDLIKIGINVDGQTVQLESSSNVQTTDWQFVAFTWSSGESIQLYLDGVLDTPNHVSAPAAGALSDVTRLQIGQPPKGDAWSGLVDDVRIYSRALSADEIAALHLGAPSNVAPQVSAGLDTQVDSNEITLAGSGEDDGSPADPGSVTYQWQLLEGPGQAYFADLSDPASPVNVDAFGEYTFRLTADDGHTATADDVSVILAPTGDTDFDGSVDFSDTWTVLSHYRSGEPANWGQGDFNGDGQVDAADASLLRSNYGTDLTDLLTSAGPYTIQPRLGATVSAPVSLSDTASLPASVSTDPASPFQAPATTVSTVRSRPQVALADLIAANPFDPADGGPTDPADETHAWGTPEEAPSPNHASLEPADDLLATTPALRILQDPNRLTDRATRR